MEEELKCPFCRKIFTSPVMLPCYHNACLDCALNFQQVYHTQRGSDSDCLRNGLGLSSEDSLPPLLPPPPPILSSINLNLGGDISSSSSSSITSPTNQPNLNTSPHCNSNHHNQNPTTITNGNSIGAREASLCSSSASSETSDPDKLSLISETDSGVICSNSRPSSYVGTPNLGAILFPSSSSSSSSSSNGSLNATSNSVYYLQCPVCHKFAYMDDSGAHSLPKNRTLTGIVTRYEESQNSTLRCQLCESSAKEASTMCEQCNILYCEGCREQYHPARGPLAKHNMMPASSIRTLQRNRLKSKDWSLKCPEHIEMPLSNFCLICKIPICDSCNQDNRHSNHNVHSLAAMCKTQKTELSQNLQSLSEKAKTVTEHIQYLKGMQEKVNESCTQLESIIIAECDMLIQAIHKRKMRLFELIQKEREYKVRRLKDQVSTHTVKLQTTTGLIQFCIEALKETDPTSFLQIGSSLMNRVNGVENSWQNDLISTSSMSNNFELTLDTEPVYLAIDQLNFAQMKAPSAPLLIPEECITENNSITIAWQPQEASFVETFVLEVDDGNGGAFKEVYHGKETICSVDGLHFGCMYRSRVKAVNSAGHGPYSDIITLHTAEVAWFSLDPSSCPTDLLVSNSNQTLTGETYENRVILGNIGLSRGIHYWEISIDRYDGSADPAFGVALRDVSRDGMLGKDDKGWSMYIDDKRSWFFHCGSHHNRIEGGIETGSIVGVLLDLENHELRFSVNDEPQGGISLGRLEGVLYPAISLNRNVKVTIHSGLEPPPALDSKKVGVIIH